MRLPLTLIAAVGRNGVIGRDGALPWHLPGDLAHFRTATMHRPVILGRKTFDAIGRPLPGRFLIVLSRDQGYRPEGVEIAADLEEALAKAQAIGIQAGAAEIMVAGGASVYAATIDQADALLITEVALAPVGEARFPPIDPAAWTLVERGPDRHAGW